MNTTPIPQPIPPIPVIKPTFFNLVVMHDYDYPTLQLIATMAGVEKYVVSAMFTTVAVHCADAEKILAAFSEYTQETYTFDNVKVALHPTFSDIVETHKLDTSVLAAHSAVPLAIVDMMLCDEPVPVNEARLVLQAASGLFRHDYTLDNVDIALSQEPAPHAPDTTTPTNGPTHPVPRGSQSEVARLMQQIDAEVESGKQALQGLALGTARHEFITKRMENIGGLHEQLQELIGDEAMPLIIEKLDQLNQLPQTQTSATP
jgi:hypothetical protein